MYSILHACLCTNIYAGVHGMVKECIYIPITLIIPESIMNHNNGFIIGIPHVFVKTLIECVPKNHLENHPHLNHPLVALCEEYRSPSNYQVKRKQYVYIMQN